jgi:hypothetical protein
MSIPSSCDFPPTSPSPNSGRRMSNLFKRNTDESQPGRYLRKKLSITGLNGQSTSLSSPTTELPPSLEHISAPPLSPPSTSGRSFSVASQRSNQSGSAFSKSSSANSLLVESLGKTYTVDEEETVEELPARSHSVKMPKIVRKFTGRLKISRTKSHSTEEQQRQHCASTHPEEPTQMAPGLCSRSQCCGVRFSVTSLLHSFNRFE